MLVSSFQVHLQVGLLSDWSTMNIFTIIKIIFMAIILLHLQHIGRFSSWPLGQSRWKSQRSRVFETHAPLKYWINGMVVMTNYRKMMSCTWTDVLFDWVMMMAMMMMHYAPSMVMMMMTRCTLDRRVVWLDGIGGACQWQLGGSLPTGGKHYHHWHQHQQQHHELQQHIEYYFNLVIYI